MGLAAMLAALLASGLAFIMPDGWKSTPPASSMRVAEFTLPHAARDTDDAQLIVYYFGGSGGSVAANIDRWLGQMQQPDGKPSAAVAKKESRQVNGLTVSLLDVSGTYTAEMAPGSTEHHNKPHFRMRAGVVETPRGPYFIKLTGPEQTVAKWDAAFNQFVGSFKIQ